MTGRGSVTDPAVRTRAVFFDVDFTLIYPGPTFQGEGYAGFAARYGMAIDPNRFSDAVQAASPVLHDSDAHVYDAEIFVRYTGRIIEEMGGCGPHVETCARVMYDEWASCRHFFLYDDVMPALRGLVARGVKVGLISNSHRSLSSFEEHFDLSGLIAASVSSHEHGYLKPHGSIFKAALARVGVTAEQSMMVGDSLAHDVEGARRVGMRGVLVQRSSQSPFVAEATDVPVIRDLSELAAYL